MVAPVTRESLLWGAIGALAFLVLIQGYDLLAVASIDASVKAAVALLVFLVTAGSTYVTRRRALETAG